jgi:hypothetical protein
MAERQPHPERTLIETALGLASLALGGTFWGFFLAYGHQRWQHLASIALFVLGAVFALLGAYVFMQFYVDSLPSLPSPKSARVRQPESAAHRVARDILKEDGHWPPWWKFWGGIGLS